MNIQTERLDNHTARFTVEVEDTKWEGAKKEAAREISKQIRVKGFRKGKAPYGVVVRNVGEGVIIEEAMEKLGNEIYREVIETTEHQPYAPGSLEDFQLEPQPTYVFSVPLAPEINLGDYRDIRVEYTEPTVSDEDVDRAMRQYQQQEAVVEDSASPIQSGDRVTINIHSTFADGDEEGEEDGEDQAPLKGANFIYEHDAEVNLDPENEPALPGFIDALVGASIDETVEFDLTVPEDEERYSEGIRGRKIHFEVTVHKIQNVTLPELNDDLAARITDNDKDDEEPLTLLQLRTRTREELQKQAENEAKSAYSDEVLSKIAKGATLSYPEIMVVERIHEMIEDLDQNLQQQGMDLETYQKVMGITHDDLHDQFEAEAVESLERSLVLGEVLLKEEIKVTAEDVAGEIEKTLAQFGEQADIFRQFFDNEQQRSRIASNLLFQRVMDRLAKIGKGESLEEDVVEVETSDEPQATVAEEESAAEVEETPETEDEVVETDTSESEVDDIESDE